MTLFFLFLTYLHTKKGHLFWRYGFEWKSSEFMTSPFGLNPDGKSGWLVHYEAIIEVSRSTKSWTGSIWPIRGQSCFQRNPLFFFLLEWRESTWHGTVCNFALKLLVAFYWRHSLLTWLPTDITELFSLWVVRKNPSFGVNCIFHKCLESKKVGRENSSFICATIVKYHV